MSKFILSKAMGNIPDDMLVEAMDVKKATGRKWIIRAAACAAVLALLITVVALSNTEPFFSVQVYANETDSVELNEKGTTFFVPVYKAHSKEEDPSYRPEFDSTLGSEGTMEQMLYLSIYLNDATKNYDHLNVFVDGQPLGPNSKEGYVGYKFKNGEVGRFVRLDVNENTRLDIVFCDENGKELQHYGMRIEPVEGGWNVTLDEIYVSVWQAGIFRGFR